MNNHNKLLHVIRNSEIFSVTKGIRFNGPEKQDIQDICIFHFEYTAINWRDKELDGITFVEYYIDYTTRIGDFDKSLHVMEYSYGYGGVCTMNNWGVLTCDIDELFIVMEDRTGMVLA